MPKLQPITLGEIDDVLNKLYTEHGYFTYPFGKYPCCQSCGLYELPQEKKDDGRYLFFNHQGYQSAFDNWGREDYESEEEDPPMIFDLPKREDQMFIDLYLAWGHGIEPEIVKAAFAEKNITLNGGEDAHKALVVDKFRFAEEETNDNARTHS